MSRLHHGNRVSFHDASSPSLRIKVVELTCLLGDAFDLASTDAKAPQDAGFRHKDGTIREPIIY